MSKKIFVVSAFGAGSEDVKYAALIWARKHGTAFNKDLGKINFFYMVGEDKLKGTKFTEKLADRFGDTSPADSIILSGWRVTEHLNLLYEQFKDEATFILVRRQPEEMADKFAKGFFLKRPGKMPTLDENSYLEKVKIHRKIIEDFVVQHGLEWTRVSPEIFDDELNPKPSPTETTTKRDVIVIKPQA